MGRGNLSAVGDGSGDPWGGLGLIGGPSGMSRTGRGTLGEVRIRGGRPSGKSGTGQENLVEVWDRSEDPPVGQGPVGGPSRMYEMGRGTPYV